MNWEDILKEKEDLTEKVIEALMPMYDNREEIFDSFILGAFNKKDLQRPYTKQDVRSLIADIEFAANANEGEDYKKIMESLRKLEKLQ
jgi:hypothetical protein